MYFFTDIHLHKAAPEAEAQKVLTPCPPRQVGNTVPFLLRAPWANVDTVFGVLRTMSPTLYRTGVPTIGTIHILRKHFLTRGVFIKSQIKLNSKGQLISKADWRARDSPKKRTDEFVLFAFLLFTANKSNSSVRFLGESTARQSAFWFYLTFKGLFIYS